MCETAEALGVASLGACLHASSTGAIASFVACVFQLFGVVLGLLRVQEAMNVGDGGGVGSGLSRSLSARKQHRGNCFICCMCFSFVVCAGSHECGGR